MAAKKEETPMLDPIAYRSDYNPNNIIEEYKGDPNIPGVGPQNANLNYKEYGDDSNPEWQSQRGGLNPKYEGEGVSNTYIDYDPNLKTSDLDPNYLYGENARQQNSKEAGYIARRNDQIASALYNEGLTSREDVENYLNQQGGWMDSTEADRVNTVESIWKRLGEKAADTTAMEENIRGEDTSGTLYGKNTANEGNPEEGIPALSDENSVFRMMEESRIAKVKELLSMSTDAIAAAIYGGELSEGTQQMRDYKENYPQLYEEVQTKLKQFRGQNAINNITKGETDYVTDEVETKTSSLENDKINKAEEYSSSKEETQNIVNSLNSDLETNQSVITAEDTMAKITDEMNKLKTRLKNLKNEANEVFKGDVPDYIVKAYINNRTQEINDRLQELQYNYDMAYQRNRDAIDDAWKWREFGLKQDQLNLQKEQEGFDQWYKKQTLARSSVYTDENGVSWQLNVADDGSLYYTKIEQIQTYAESGMKGAGLKNNNPGNIKDTQFGNVIGTGANGFAQFATPEDGFDALVEKMKFNQTNPKSRYYGKTILEYYQIYAPESDGNDPVAYANDIVAKYNKATGEHVTINTKISELDPWHWAGATAKHDSGYDYSTYGQFRKSAGKDVDLSNIDIPLSIFESVDENGVGISINPNSEEGKQRIKDYVAAYILQNGIANTSDTSYNSGPISSDGITPELYRQRIYNLVPAGLKNGDQERENLYDIAKTYYLAGYTADEAALAFYGVDVHNDKTGLMQSLVDIARSSGTDLPDTFYGNMGSFTERGLGDYAVKLTENSVLPKEQRQEITATTTMLQNLQNVKKTLETVESFGPISGRVTGLANKFKSNKDYQTAVSAMQNAFADLRNSLLGTQISEKEASYYDKIFPDETDLVENVKISIGQSEIALMNKINTIRKNRGLPEVTTIEQALYPSLRTELYIDFD